MHLRPVLQHFNSTEVRLWLCIRFLRGDSTRISILQKYDYGSVPWHLSSRRAPISILQKYDYGQPGDQLTFPQI